MGPECGLAILGSFKMLYPPKTANVLFQSTVWSWLASHILESGSDVEDKSGPHRFPIWCFCAIGDQTVLKVKKWKRCEVKYGDPLTANKTRFSQPGWLLGYSGTNKVLNGLLGRSKEIEMYLGLERVFWRMRQQSGWINVRKQMTLLEEDVDNMTDDVLWIRIFHSFINFLRKNRNNWANWINTWRVRRCKLTEVK